MRGPYYGVSYWKQPTTLERMSAEQRLRETARRQALQNLPALAYNAGDTEARWLLDRATPGAFAAARTLNRLRELAKQTTCEGCGGRGFCHCEALTVEALRAVQA